jgi:hypothetical protein
MTEQTGLWGVWLVSDSDPVQDRRTTPQWIVMTGASGQRWTHNKSTADANMIAFLRANPTCVYAVRELAREPNDAYDADAAMVRNMSMPRMPTNAWYGVWIEGDLNAPEGRWAHGSANVNPDDAANNAQAINRESVLRNRSWTTSVRPIEAWGIWNMSHEVWYSQNFSTQMACDVAMALLTKLRHLFPEIAYVVLPYPVSLPPEQPAVQERRNNTVYQKGDLVCAPSDQASPQPTCSVGNLTFKSHDLPRALYVSDHDEELQNRVVEYMRSHQIKDPGEARRQINAIAWNRLSPMQQKAYDEKASIVRRHLTLSS